jgi:hypothetical protein
MRQDLIPRSKERFGLITRRASELVRCGTIFEPDSTRRANVSENFEHAQMLGV